MWAYESHLEGKMIMILDLVALIQNSILCGSFCAQATREYE